MLNYVLLGDCLEYQPNYYCFVKWNNNKREKITFIKSKELIEYFTSFDFSISKNETVINLGNILKIQRKGGDGGKKTSNQIQFKLCIKNIQIENKLEYFF